MIRMKNRMQAPVNGWQFFQSQTGWNMVAQNPQAQWDFSLAVQSIIAHRKLNPRFNLPTDQLSVENELDYTNAKRMASIQGADSYIQSNEDPIPKPLPQQHHGLQAVVGGVRNVAAGALALVEWIKDGAEAVPQAKSNERSGICAMCQFNTKGDWTTLFTIPVSNAIKSEIAKRTDWQLSTPNDAALNVCSVCLCPLKLLVHVPLEHKLKTMPKETQDALPEWCWVRKEQNA